MREIEAFLDGWTSRRSAVVRMLGAATKPLHNEHGCANRTRPDRRGGRRGRDPPPALGVPREAPSGRTGASARVPGGKRAQAQSPVEGPNAYHLPQLEGATTHMISTRELSGMPEVEGFCTLTKSLAMLDAILSPEWEYRCYSFNSNWDRSKGEMLASMRNGEGDLWFAILCSDGVALHGLAHDAPTFIPGKPQPWVFRDLPPEFHESLLHEPAADTANSTFCIWRRASDSAWHTGIRQPGEDRGDDGSARFLSILIGDPQVYVGFAAEYYETDIALEDVRAVYEHRPLDAALVSRLNQAADFEQMLREAPEIGYPAVAI